MAVIAIFDTILAVMAIITAEEAISMVMVWFSKVLALAITTPSNSNRPPRNVTTLVNVVPKNRWVRSTTKISEMSKVPNLIAFSRFRGFSWIDGSAMVARVAASQLRQRNRRLHRRIRDGLVSQELHDAFVRCIGHRTVANARAWEAAVEPGAD